MDLFLWLKSCSSQGPVSQEFEATMVLLLAKYGLPLNQEMAADILQTRSPLGKLLYSENIEFKVMAVQGIDSLAYRKVLPNERLDWCYKMVLDALQKDTSSISNDTIYLLYQEIKTVNSLVTLKPLITYSQDILSNLKPLLLLGNFSYTSGTLLSRQSSTDVLSSEDEGTYRISCVYSEGTDSEVSDSECAVPIDLKTRTLCTKIRQQAFQCLGHVIHSMDHKAVFSQWSHFLSPSAIGDSSPSLQTCLLKERSAKVRINITVALTAFLEGTKPLLSAADDRPLSSCSFIPFSHWLGSVIRDLHRTLLLAVSTEDNAKTLLKLLKCVNALLINMPYGRLSEPYQTRVAISVKSLLSHKNADVLVASLSCFTTLLSSSSSVELKEWIKQSPPPSLLSILLEILSPLGEHKVVQIAALQVLGAAAKCHPESISSSVDKVTQVLLSSLDVHELTIHAMRVFEEFWRSCQTQMDILPLEKMCTIWGYLLKGSLSQHLQGTCPPLLSAGCELMATIGSVIFETLEQPLSMFILSVMLGLSKHDVAGVQASAIRTLGIYVQFPVLQDDVAFILDTLHAVCMHVRTKDVQVRLQAAWSLGNLCDIVKCREEVLTPPMFAQLVDACLVCSKDQDSVRVNGIRGLGHLLSSLSEKHLGISGPKIKPCLDTLSKTILSGSSKVRWNACHAAANALKSPLLMSRFSVEAVISALTKSLYGSKNFKVRISATSALCGVSKHPFTFEVWEGLVKAIKASEDISDFSEFKHKSNLRKKLLELFNHLLKESSSKKSEQIKALLKSENKLFIGFLSNVKAFEDGLEEQWLDLLATLTECYDILYEDLMKVVTVTEPSLQ